MYNNNRILNILCIIIALYINKCIKYSVTDLFMSHNIIITAYKIFYNNKFLNNSFIMYQFMVYCIKEPIHLNFTVRKG